MNKKGKIAAGAAVAVSVVAILAAAYSGWTGSWITGTKQNTSAAAQGSPEQKFSEIVARYRKIIVLAQGPEDQTDPEQERVSAVGRIIYHEQLRLHEDLFGMLRSDLLRTGIENNPQQASAVDGFLDRLERDPDLWDADKLAFRDLLLDLHAALDNLVAAPDRLQELKNRIAEDQKGLDQIQALYSKEIERVMSRIRLRGIPVCRESWDKYVVFLQERYRRDDILNEYDRDRTLVPASRGPGPTLGRDEINGSGLPSKTVVMTFDDGPHHRYTDQILALLQKYGANAVFFQVGKNVGLIGEQGDISLTTKSEISRRVVEKGFLLANHSQTHTELTRVDSRRIASEIRNTNSILETITGTRPVLFRPPYGSRNADVHATVRSENMKTIMWNVDSMDWADPIPQSIANRVLEQIAGREHGIVLLHDIHGRTVEALEIILKALREDGYRFAAWDGQSFVATGGAVETKASTKPALAAQPLYRESWAAVIGIDDYEKWPKLRYAMNDAEAVREILIRRYRFKPENIFTLYNGEATRKNILSLLGDKLADPQRVQRDDRVFVFFAGHGTTRRLATGRDLGYIVPVEADGSDFQGQSISMTNFRDIAEAIPAKHLLFVMDSCYSGLGLTRGAATPGYLHDLSRRTARQILTAGGADQQVADEGPNGHSVFTWTLLQALEGSGDLNGDGYITASELAAYAVPIVASVSQQTPAFGNIPGSEGGDFVFDRNHEGEDLSELSEQLDDEAIRLNTELERLRKDIVAKRERNLKLQQELKAAQTQAESPTPAVDSAAETAARHSDRGLALYKEKKYKDALEEFIAATRINPADAQAANNLGFMYYKLDQMDEAILWIKKAISLDPNRIVAYRNLGDAYEGLGRSADAGQAYEKYLSLNPPAKSAASIKDKLKNLRQSLAP
ncbi:MAG: polysaccharide deacetylase family protein [Woeseiaceae bacterium]|nr:polysaccharide deacetylase family protein [Woeseiaceae bacterium]